MLTKYKKQIRNSVLLLTLLFVTFYLVLKDQELDLIVQYIRQALLFPLCLGCLLAGAYIVQEAMVMSYLFHKLENRVSMVQCIRYACIGFFYNAVTPSASGGQPMQVVYMKRDQIPIAESSLVLIIMTIVYKVILLLIGSAAIIFYGLQRRGPGRFGFLVLYGILANILFIGLLIVLLFKQSFAKRAVITIILWLGKHRIIRNYDRFLRKTYAALSKYDHCAGYIKRNIKIFNYVFLFTFLQRICLFAVTFMVYKSFGLRGRSIYEVTALQSLIALAADSLPLPGGIGVSESSFVLLFGSIFGETLVYSGMLLSRGLSYYFLLSVSACVTIAAHLTGKGRRSRVVR